MTRNNGHPATPRRAIVLGKGTLAIRVSRWFEQSPAWELASVVPTVPEPAWTDSLISWAEANRIPHVSSGRYDDLEGVHTVRHQRRT